MTSKLLSRRDIAFLLYEWLDVESLTKRERFADHSRETFDAAMLTCERIATDLFEPHNKKSDQNEPHFDGERVTMIPEVARALAAFSDAGLMAAGRDYEIAIRCREFTSVCRLRVVQGGQRRHVVVSVPDDRQLEPAARARLRRAGRPLREADADRPLLRHDVPVGDPGRLVAVGREDQGRSAG